VVLVPLTLVGTILMLVRRKWRKALGWWVVILAGFAMVFSWVAKESGEALAGIVGEPETHAELGDVMPLVSGVLFLAVLIYVAVDRLMDRPSDDSPGRTPVLVTILGIVAVVVGLGATYQIYRVGDSGAKAVWAEEVAATASGGSADQTAPDADKAATEPSAAPSDKAKSGPTAYTMAEVAKHDTNSDCWVVIDSNVYNLTKWISEHPGGPSPIEAMCGTDGTSAFRDQHGTERQPNAELATFKIGTVS
jgi:cytochrome b involved in lipid metabolism